MRTTTVWAWLMAATLGAGCGASRSPHNPPAANATLFTEAEANPAPPTWVVTEEGPEGWTLFTPHDNEETATQASLELITQRGGRLVEIRTGGTREGRFAVRGITYTFDPNRMFTDAGIRATLSHHGPTSDEAESLVRRFAQEVVAQLLEHNPALVIAVHNNTEQAYSAQSYAPGGELALDAREVHLVPDGDPDDFFFVTDLHLYQALVQRNYNVVLQNNETVTDDGSLSVYCGQRGIPYVNVEAQHGHLHEQVDMLETLRQVLSELQREEAP